MNLSFNTDELTVITAAAERDRMVPSSWAARAALAVAKEMVVPVSVGAKDVLAELIQARGELGRIGNNWNQIAYQLNAGGTVTLAQLEAVAVRVEQALQRVDDATLQVMRERQARS